MNVKSELAITSEEAPRYFLLHLDVIHVLQPRNYDQNAQHLLLLNQSLATLQKNKTPLSMPNFRS